MALIKKILALLIIACIMLSFASCDDDVASNDDENIGNNDTDNTGNKEQTYTVKVVNSFGMKLEGITVLVHKSDAEYDTAAEPKTTDSNGEVSFTLTESEDYSVQVLLMPDKYYDRYSVVHGAGPYGRQTFVDNTAVITLDYAEGYKPAIYSIGDKIADFTVTDVYGCEQSIYDILEDKDMVMLNFWYMDCKPCKLEFSAINSAYNNHKDSVEILAIDPVAADSAAEVKEYPKSNNLTIDFPLIADSHTITNKKFGVAEYPTTVIIDRYGVICMIESGGENSSVYWNNLFSYFTSDDYEQSLIISKDAFMPKN